MSSSEVEESGLAKKWSSQNYKSSQVTPDCEDTRTGELLLPVCGSIGAKRCRPDLRTLLPSLAINQSTIAVLACGPDQLVRSAQRVSHTEKFSFHKETFAF